MGCVETRPVLSKKADSDDQVFCCYVRAVPEPRHPFLSSIDALDWKFLNLPLFNMLSYPRMKDRVMFFDENLEADLQIGSSQKWLNTISVGVKNWVQLYRAELYKSTTTLVLGKYSIDEVVTELNSFLIEVEDTMKKWKNSYVDSQVITSAIQ